MCQPGGVSINLIQPTQTPAKKHYPVSGLVCQAKGNRKLTWLIQNQTGFCNYNVNQWHHHFCRKPLNHYKLGLGKISILTAWNITTCTTTIKTKVSGQMHGVAKKLSQKPFLESSIGTLTMRFLSTITVAPITPKTIGNKANNPANTESTRKPIIC